MADLSRFKGTLPYATELRGVYQPLLGWESKSALNRVAREAVLRADQTFRSLVRDSRLSVNADQSIWSLNAPLPPLIGGLNNPLTQLVAVAVRDNFGGAQTLTPQQWQSFLTPQFLQGLVQKAVDLGDQAQGGTSPDPASGGPAPGAVSDRNEAVRRYVATASLLGYLGQASPQTLDAIFFTNAIDWLRQLTFVNPLASFAEMTRQEVLSPVGLLHIFRQYFYEFESFLGPAVGHVWLSPGGTVELVEVNVRKTLQERTSEMSLEVSTKSETSVTNQDEISDAVKQENADNIKFGASASGGFNVLVAHGEASATFNADISRKTASESTHKQTRQQSEKLSSEIRRNYKTTFRTVSEQTDTSSRRYVIQNATNELVNYELRRKMRQVGVQLQHIATQLCWQSYLDEPGIGLRTSALVHVARPEDADPGQPPPEAPTPMPAKEVQASVPFSLQIIDNPENNKDAPGATYFKGYYSGPRSGTDYIKIKYIQSFKYSPPLGMVLSRVELVAAPIARIDPNQDAPHPFTVLPPTVEAGKEAEGLFDLEVPEVNFHWQPYIPVPVKLVYEEAPASFDARNKEYQQRLQQYHEDKSRSLREAYVKAVRERIKLAGSVKTRPYSDLREEERHVVFRRLIETLTANTGSQDPHVVSELVRRIFDVDSMMYFVAPDWWQPKKRTPYDQELGQLANTQTPLTLTEDDKVGWGGIKDQRREKYLITEESNPAPLGASLGWLLQLDGDNLRNAFLNAVWVKAVIPIRPGREQEALEWLQQHNVEGAQGLSANYSWQNGDPEEFKGKTVAQVLSLLAAQVANQYDASRTLDPNTKSLPTEVVFEHGFDPLQGGVRVDAKPFEVYDQWTEVLPTDQVVAAQVKYDPKTGTIIS